MKVRIELAVDVDETTRRAIGADLTDDTFTPKPATRDQVEGWYLAHLESAKVRIKELADKVDEDSARCYPLRRGTVLVPGRSVVKVRGQRGAEFVYQGWRASPRGDVLTVVGGKAGHKLTRSFRADQITKVRQPRNDSRAVGDHGR